MAVCKKCPPARDLKCNCGTRVVFTADLCEPYADRAETVYSGVCWQCARSQRCGNALGVGRSRFVPVAVSREAVYKIPTERWRWRCYGVDGWRQLRAA